MKKVLIGVFILVGTLVCMSFVRTNEGETTTFIVGEQSFEVPANEFYNGIENGETFTLSDLSNGGVPEGGEGTTTIVCPGDEIDCWIWLFNPENNKLVKYNAKKYNGTADISKPKKNGTKESKIVIDM